jgi:hypothetical protein
MLEYFTVQKGKPEPKKRKFLVKVKKREELRNC